MNLPEWQPTWLEKVLLGIGFACLIAWFIHHSVWFFLGMLFVLWALRVLAKEHKLQEQIAEAQQFEPAPVYGQNQFASDAQLGGDFL